MSTVYLKRSFSRHYVVQILANDECSLKLVTYNSINRVDAKAKFEMVFKNTTTKAKKFKITVYMYNVTKDFTNYCTNYKNLRLILVSFGIFKLFSKSLGIGFSN